MGALGKLWLAGAPIDWSGLYVHERRRRLQLPTYPFERERYWVSQGGVDLRPRVAGHTSPLHPRQEQIGAYVAPEGILEQSIAEVWQEVIGIDRIGVHDNFFELGGHSLLALQVMNRLKESLQVSLRMQVLFENPTIRELSSAIMGVMSSELDQLSEEEARRLLESEL
jgi:acyl transferase domain-containing protein